MSTAAPLLCRICGSAATAPVPFGYDFRGRRLQGNRCSRCGVMFLNPFPTEEEIASLYSREYFEGDFRCGHEGSCFDDADRASLAGSGLLDRIRRLRPSGRLLDLGCAGGAFLNAARDAGYAVQGVELSPEAAQFARDRFGLEVRTGDLLQARFQDGAFDIIYSGDVIEHLLHPREVMTEARRILAPGGVIVLACPSQTNTLFSRLGFAVFRMLGRQATVALPPYHLFEYRPRSIRALLDVCGFERIVVKQYTIPPREIALRGSLAQRIGKKAFQYPNYAMTGLLGVCGDRLEVIGHTPHD